MENGTLTTSTAAARLGLTPRRLQQLAHALRARGIHLPQAPYGQGTLWPREVVEALEEHRGEGLEVLLQDPRLTAYRKEDEALAAALAVEEALEAVWGVRKVLNALARNDSRWDQVFRKAFGGLE